MLKATRFERDSVLVLLALLLSMCAVSLSCDDPPEPQPVHGYCKQPAINAAEIQEAYR